MAAYRFAPARLPGRLRKNTSRAVAFGASAALVAGLLAATAPAGAGVPEAAAGPVSPTNQFDVTGEPELDEPATVTLITGDTVTMNPDGSVEAEAGAGREKVTFDTRSVETGTLVVPSDAAALLANDALDPRLFNVSYLVREGYDDASRDDLPLILQGAPASMRGLADDGEARVLSGVPGLGMSTVSTDKSGEAGDLWSRMTHADGDQRSTLSSGVEKVWLDGMSHATLDDSVPQVGAPSAWDSGYTGDGVTVAVLDTGVDSTHPDLEGQVVAEEVFAQNPVWLGVFMSEQVGFPIKRYAADGAQPVPSSGTSDPLVNVGRACTETEGDELEGDPVGKTALIVRGVCPFAEKYDAAVEAGATAVVFYNDDAGAAYPNVAGAEHEYEVWSAGITQAAGTELVEKLAGGAEIRLTLADNFTGDVYGHGTHVASTVAGTGAASDGARRGVAPDAEVMNGKVCHDDGSCQDSSVIAGMVWATSNGADIVNMSLGGAPTDGTDLLAQVVNTLTEASDTLFVTSSGNSGEQWMVGTPGSADTALTVGAVDKNGAMADFSSRGPRAGDDAVKPEISAPGVNIVAARAAGTAMGAPVDGHHTASNGTSMAAPHVAGAAALLAQAQPHLDATGLKDVLVSTATDEGHPWLAQGTGLLDVARAVEQDVYADAIINVGTFDADGGEPVTREITYTNEMRRSAILRLDATVTDQFGREVANIPMSRRPVVVRGGAQASVPITIDPEALGIGAGVYGVEVAATDRHTSLRTVMGFTIERDTVPLEDNWDEDWTKKVAFDAVGQTIDVKGAELSSDGEQIFVFGTNRYAYAPDAALTVMAVDANSGEQVWRTDTPVAYSSPGVSPGIAVAPDDSAVYLTQEVWDPENEHANVITAAYNNVPPTEPDGPDLGEQVWHVTQDKIGSSQNNTAAGVLSIEPTPDGNTVLVLINQVDPGPGHGGRCESFQECTSTLLTIAYDAQTGEQSWVARHKRNYAAAAGDLVIGPSGDTAYVTTVEESGDGQKYGVTVAYDLVPDAAGEVRWLAEHDRYPVVHVQPAQVTTSADGARVFVTGSVRANESLRNYPMETLAFDANTGERLWASNLSGADYGFGPGHTTVDRDYKDGGIVAGPDDDLVYLTGQHCEGGECTGAHSLVTVAYDQDTGEQRWVQWHESSGWPGGQSRGSPRGTTAAVSPDGSLLYVAGTCCFGPVTEGRKSDQVTIAYDTATGELVSTARHRYEADGMNEGQNEGQQVLVAPGGEAVYTVGSSLFGGLGDTEDFVGIAAYTSSEVPEQ